MADVRPIREVTGRDKCSICYPNLTVIQIDIRVHKV